MTKGRAYTGLAFLTASAPMTDQALYLRSTVTIPVILTYQASEGGVRRQHTLLRAARRAREERGGAWKRARERGEHRE